MQTTSPPVADPLREPIVIVGAPRSGTTFLGNLFGSLPTLALAHEHRLTWRYGNDRRSDILSPADARPEVRRYIRQRLAEVVHSSSAVRLVEKLPANCLRLGFVDAVLPGARYIHILRDGRDAVPSIARKWQSEGKLGSVAIERHRMLRRFREATWRQRGHYTGQVVRRLLPASRSAPPLWGPQLPGIGDMVNEIGAVGVAAMQWRTCVELAVAYGRSNLGDRYVEIRFEELDRERVAALAAFAGVDDAAALVDRFEERYAPPARTDWDDALTGAERQLMHGLVDATRQLVGYG